VHRFGSSPTKGHRIASASGSSHRQLHDGGYPPFLPFQPVPNARDGLKGEKRCPFLALGSSQLCELPDAEAIRCPMSEDFRKDALAVAAYPASIRSVGDVDLIVPEPTSTVGSRQEYEGVRPTTLQELAASNRMRIARGPNLRDRGIPFDAKLFDGETTYNLAELDKQVELFIVAKTLVARETRDEMARMQKERVATGQSTSIRDMWRGGWDGGIDMDALQDGAIRATDEEVQTALQKLKLSRANVILEIPVFCLLITEWKPSEMFGPDIFESVRQRIVDIPIKSP